MTKCTYVEATPEHSDTYLEVVGKKKIRNTIEGVLPQELIGTGDCRIVAGLKSMDNGLS